MKKASVIFLSVALSLCLSFAANAAQPEISIQKAGKAPVLDGVVTEEEWGKPVITMTNQSSETNYIDTTDKSAVPDKTEIYALWDDQCI